jgi:hypothetical protein
MTSAVHLRNAPLRQCSPHESPLYRKNSLSRVHFKETALHVHWRGRRNKDKDIVVPSLAKTLLHWIS